MRIKNSVSFPHVTQNHNGHINPVIGKILP